MSERVKKKPTARKKPAEKKKPTPSERTRALRSAAGKKGMMARWGKHGETVTVRAYPPDAAKLRAMAPTMADAIRQLMEGADGAAPAGRRQA